MYLPLTDRLVCPRCGPPFGLILLADRVADRAVVDGKLGCPNCRESYPIVAGVADLRPPPRDRLEPPPVGDDSADQNAAIQMLAALGLEGGGGLVLLLGGRAARNARELRRFLPEIQWVAADVGRIDGAADPELTRIIVRNALPFHDATFRGVVGAGLFPCPPEELQRVLASRGRLCFIPRDSVAAAQFDALGLDVIVDESSTLVVGKG